MNPTGKHRPKSRHHGQGTIVERRDQWRREPFLWTLRGMHDGRRIVLASCSATSRAEAARKARAILRELDRGASPDALTMTVAEMLDRWLATTADHVRPGSFVSYRGTVRRLRPAFADVTLARLDAETVRAKLTGTAGQRARGLLILRAAMRQAVTERLIPVDPTAGIRPPRRTTREAPTIDAATARAILAAVEGDQLGPLVTLALTTGLRRGELLGLRWSDVADGSLRVRHSLRRIPPEYRAPGEPAVRLVEPKTERSARLIPLTARAVAALEVQRRRQDEARAAAKVWADNDLVFCEPESGNPMWPGSVTRKVEDLLRRVVPGMRLHDLRAGYATLLAASGAHPRTARGLLGHTALGQSMDYTKVVPEEAVAAARALDEVMG